MTLLRSGSSSDTGLVRSVNQDLVIESTNLFAVADGMGGHAGGEVAARIAVDSLTAAFNRKPTGVGLSEAATVANTMVWERSHEDPDLRGMGTTLTAVALVNEAGHDVLALINVGDSRTYRFHEGELTQITTDHSLAVEMVRTGELSEAEAESHPHRHILTRALGVSAEVSVDLWRIQPVRGDRYLLCSDGLTNEVDDSQIAAVLSTVADPREVADLLVRAARTHGGSDNITVVVVDVVVGEDDEESTPAVSAVGAGFGDLTPGRGDRAPAANWAAEGAGEPSRRMRRRARRRARRIARGRRLVTFRTLLFLVLLAAALVGCFAAVRWFNTSSYFVKADGNELMIYQGRIGGFLWYHPVEIERTGATIADVPVIYKAALLRGVEESSAASARTYVSNLVCQRQQELNRTCSSGVVPNTVVTPTTGAVPGTTGSPTPAAAG